MKTHYKIFVNWLETITQEYSIDELQNLDWKILIKKFFAPKFELFVNIELLMLTIAVASVKHSCESILKRFVSEYENHFDERCNVDETTANEEFTIAVNGPNLAHDNSVILQDMDLYWKGKPWHFFTSSSLEKLIHISGT